jgi:DNA-binding transcriptional LysR family regulator
MFTLVQLRTFLAVARNLHFTRAAEELQVAQPSVSYQVRELERRLKVQLIQVVGHRVYLTDAGERLAERATALLNDLEDAERELRDYGTATRGRLRLGATHAVGVYALPPVLAAFRQERPQIELHLAIENVRTIEQMLLDRAIDLGVVEWTVQSGDLAARPLRRYAVVLIAPLGHPFAARSRVEVNDLRGAPFVFRETGSGIRALSDRVLAPIAREIEVVLELDQPEAVTRAVEAGLGLAFTPALVAESQLAAGSVRQVPLVGMDLDQDFILARLRERPATPAMAAFQAFLEQTWAGTNLAPSPSPGAPGEGEGRAPYYPRPLPHGERGTRRTNLTPCPSPGAPGEGQGVRFTSGAG